MLNAGDWPTPWSTSADFPRQAKLSTWSPPSATAWPTSCRRSCSLQRRRPSPLCRGHAWIFTAEHGGLAGHVRQRPDRGSAFSFFVYFKANDKDACQRLAEALTDPRPPGFLRFAPCEVAAYRVDGRPHYAVESSANLQLCASRGATRHDSRPQPLRLPSDVDSTRYWKARRNEQEQDQGPGSQGPGSCPTGAPGHHRHRQVGRVVAHRGPAGEHRPGHAQTRWPPTALPTLDGRRRKAKSRSLAA